MDLFGLGEERTQLVIAGALGGLVRWMTLRDKPLEGLISVTVGAISAVFLGPLALPALAPLLGGIGLATDSVSGLSGFIIGIGGITASGFFIDLWSARRKLLKKEISKE